MSVYIAFPHVKAFSSRSYEQNWYKKPTLLVQAAYFIFYFLFLFQI